MQYREFRPPPLLSRFIECVWTLHGDAVEGPGSSEKILPDGCAELILNFGEPFWEHRHTGQPERQPASFLVGQLTRPLLISPSSHAQVLGIRFHPGGTAPFFRLPLHEATNRAVSLEDLEVSWGNDLVSRSGDASSRQCMVAAAFEVLSRQLLGGPPPSAVLWATDQIVRSGGQVSVDKIARDVGVSRRQLERRFLIEVGLGPKLLCRIVRFQQVFRLVDDSAARLAAVAVDCGYYDQAHLIRDFQAFAGQTPGTLLSNLDRLTTAFTRKARMSHFSNLGP